MNPADSIPGPKQAHRKDGRWLCDLPDDEQRATLTRLEALLKSEGTSSPEEIQENLERALTHRLRDLPV